MKLRIILLITLALFVIHNNLSAAGNSTITTGSFIISAGDLLSANLFHGELYDDPDEESPDTNDDIHSFKPGITLEAGYCLYKGLALGAEFSYQHTNDIQKADSYKKFGDDLEMEATSDTKEYNYSYGPLIQYYLNFGPWKPFIKCAFLYSTNYVKYKGDGIFNSDSAYMKYKTKMYAIKSSLGVAYMITDLLGLYISYSFYYQKQKMYDFDLSGDAADIWLEYARDYKNKYLSGYLHSISFGVQFIL